MSDSSETPKVRVSDKRIGRGAPPASVGDVATDVAGENAPEERSEAPSEEAQHDFLEDLQRLQAEFDNYRKRMMREQTEIASRASSRLIEQLLPVLDSFERALQHGHTADGLELVHRELMGVLQSEGLEQIAALDRSFNPHLHEAVESHEEAGVVEPTVTKVYRTGYRLKGKVLRPAMVVVARPAEPGATEEPSSE